MISNIDDNFGVLRERLAARGGEDNTVLMFMSDNGQCGGAAGPEPGAFNAGMRGYKGSIFEGGHRIPWFVRWPNGGIGGGKGDGRSVAELTAYIDVMPTVLDLCGVGAPPERSFHGRSLAPVLRGDTTDATWTERVIVTDTQRVAQPVKWRLSCVMKNDWRLVDRDQLYDLATDPNQRANLAAQRPDIVAELRAAYEAWWTLCSQQMGEVMPISIGAEAQAIAELRTHDLRNVESDVVWNQGQIRRGQACDGYWEVLVERPGDSEFALRRWPAEAGHAIRAGIDGDDIDFRREAIAQPDWDLYTGGKALEITSAGFEITGYPRRTAPVGDEREAVMSLRLAAGPVQARAWFADADGRMQAAYYVYVRRLAGG